MIPNLFTLGNLYCGFLSIGYVAAGETRNAAILILIGMMLDSLDGRVARMLNVQSPLGMQLDSLADVVTFGAAPSFLVYSTVFGGTGYTGLFIVGLFPLFGAYRLARFNITPSSTSMKYFTGVPITAAGGIVALMTLFTHLIPNVVTMIVFFALCYLMVSTIKIPSGKDIPIPKYGTIVTIFLLSAIVVVWQTKKTDWPFFLYIAIPLYVVYLLFQFVWKKKRGDAVDENGNPIKKRFKLHRK
jgi:CDP-diacylglycerol---serine O-phosphatidyltransferase